MLPIIKTLTVIWIILKFLIAGAFIQKWKMQAIFNYENLSRIAPDYEINLAGCYLLAGIIALFILLILTKEQETI